MRFGFMIGFRFQNNMIFQVKEKNEYADKKIGQSYRYSETLYCLLSRILAFESEYLPVGKQLYRPYIGALLVRCRNHNSLLPTDKNGRSYEEIFEEQRN